MWISAVGFLGLSLLVAVIYSGLHRDTIPEILRLGLRRFLSFAALTLVFAVAVYLLTEVF